MLMSKVQAMLLTNLKSDAGLRSQWARVVHHKASLTPHHNLKPKNPSCGVRPLIPTSQASLSNPVRQLRFASRITLP